MDLNLSITFFVLATNETDLLYETVSKIKEFCPPENLNDIIVVLSSNTCPSFYALKKYKEEDSWKDVKSYTQKSRNIEGTVAELPPMVTGTHFVFMGADMEMNPATIKDFICEAKKNPDCIVAASKWKKESVIVGYGKFNKLCSRTMNLIACIFIRKRATDIFTIYQLYPMSVYKKMQFKDPKTFGYEYTLKPLRLGADYKEIPTSYEKAHNRKTNFNFFFRARLLTKFLSTAFRLGITPKKYL